MARENLDVVRRSFEAWNQNDWTTLADLYEPDAIAVAPDGWPEAGTLTGFEAIRSMFARTKDSWEDEHVEIDDLREAGPDMVLAEIRWVTRGRGSGIPFETPMAEVLTVRGGRIAAVEFYFDQAAAREAAGLSK